MDMNPGQNNFMGTPVTWPTLQNLFNVMPPDVTNQGFQQAFSHFITALVFFTFYVLYLVLNPFVYPLCWALLTGQAMFPAKYIVDRAIEDFIDNRKYPLTIKIILTPFYLLNYASDIIIDYLWRSKWNIIMISTVSAIIYFLYLKFCPLLDVVETIGPECLLILKSICENTTVAAIVFGYFILVLFAPEFANRLPVILSIPLTCIFNVMLVSYIFRIPYLSFITPIVAPLTIIGFLRRFHKRKLSAASSMTNLVEKTKHLSSSIMASPVMEPFRASAFRRQGSLDDESTESIEFELDTSTKEDQIFSPRTARGRPGTPNPSGENDIPKPKFCSSDKKRPKSSKSESEDDTDTSFSIRIVFVLYLLVLSWENQDVLGTELIILAVLFFWFLLKHFVGSVLILLDDYKTPIYDSLETFIANRYQISQLFIGCCESFNIGDSILASFIVSCSSELAVLFTVSASIFGFIVFFIYMGVQTHFEMTQAANLVGHIANMTVAKYPNIEKYSQDLDFSTMIQGLLGKMETVINNWITELLADKNETDLNIVQKQIETIFKRIYDSIVDDSNEKNSIVQNFWNALATFDWDQLREIAISNYTVVQEYSLFIINVLVLNFTLVLSTLSTYAYVALIFFMALFNALASSNDEYRPVELIVSYIPSSENKRVKRLFAKIQRSVVQVFRSTLRISIFYIFWTLITHKLFQVTLVFVPSIIAGCLAIAPLLSPYLIYIVGCLELWLIRDQSIRALIFGLSGFLPSLYVDGKIYEEVGSLRSPYFTGLAVVGGGYLFGIAGVLLGPLFLCSTVELVQFGATSLRSEHRGSIQVQTPAFATPPVRPAQLRRLQSESSFI